VVGNDQFGIKAWGYEKPSDYSRIGIRLSPISDDIRYYLAFDLRSNFCGTFLFFFLSPSTYPGLFLLWRQRLWRWNPFFFIYFSGLGSGLLALMEGGMRVVRSQGG
jgi:hypothetical protein